MPAASASSTAASVSMRRRQDDGCDGAGCQDRVAAIGEDRNAGRFRRIRARGRAADDIGAVGAHQRGVRAAHAAGDALHDDRRFVREGADHAAILAMAMRKRFLEVLGHQHIGLAFGEDAFCFGGAPADQARDDGHAKAWRLLHRGGEQAAELGQVGDAGKDADQHRAQATGAT